MAIVDRGEERVPVVREQEVDPLLGVVVRRVVARIPHFDGIVVMHGEERLVGPARVLRIAPRPVRMVDLHERSFGLPAIDHVLRETYSRRWRADVDPVFVLARVVVLDTGDEQDARDARIGGVYVVIGDRDEIVARRAVCGDHGRRRLLAVGVRRMRVELSAVHVCRGSVWRYEGERIDPCRELRRRRDRPLSAVHRPLRRLPARRHQEVESKNTGREPCCMDHRSFLSAPACCGAIRIQAATRVTVNRRSAPVQKLVKC